MTRKRSSPMGLEIYLPVLLAFIMLPLLTQAAPLQDYTEIQQYTEGCYYNYNHYNEGDRIMTNEPCLNCTCHNKMLMCYLRVCPFTKPIGHDCIVEKREDQCCPIITCPEVPVDVAHATPEVGTELSFPEKFGCSIDNKFYLEGAQVPSNPNRPCELCYCIKNRTSCLMQECTLHIDGCTPIYNKGSCCPVRYNCDHENDVLELEDHSTTTTEATTTTTTVRPTTGFIIRSTMTPSVSTDCVHKNESYADGARIASERACENCYCMRGEIICAVQECQMPMLNDNGKLCHPMPAAEGECCPSNFVCEDDAASTLSYSDTDDENSLTTTAPVKDLHSAIPEEDLQLQTHIDEEETSTKAPSIEDEAGEKVAEAGLVSTPSASENETKVVGADQESVTEEVENPKVTAIILPDSKPSYVTKAPISSDAQPESSTENDKENIETTEKVDTKYPALEKEETGTKVPTTTYELPESSTDSYNIGENYVTVTSANIEPKIEKSDSTTDIVGSESITKITPTEEEETSEVTSKSPNEVVLISSEDNATDIPTIDVKSDKEPNSLKSNESVTEKNRNQEEEKIFIDPTTLSPTDIQMSTQTFEDSQSGTKLPTIVSQQDNVFTEAPVKLSKGEGEVLGEKFDEQTSQAPTRNEGELPTADKPDEQEIDVATTEAPGKIILEEKDSKTEEPKVVRKPEKAKKEDEEEAVTTLLISPDEPEVSTKLTDDKDTEHSTEDTAALEADGVTKLPDNEKQTYVTTAFKVEDEEPYTQNVPTKSPNNIQPLSSEGSLEAFGEVKPVSDDKHNNQVNEETPSKSEDDYKPLFEEDLGSGDYTTEVTSEHQFKTSTVKSITSIILEEDNTTAKTVTLANEKPVGQENFTELSEESAESEEDNKLIDLTTTVPSKFITTSAAEKTKEDGEELEITTIKPNLADDSTFAAEVSTFAEAFTEIPSEEQTNLSSTPSNVTSDTENPEEIYITTMATSVDRKIPSVDKIINDNNKGILVGQTEVSSTPSVDDETEKNTSSNKEEDKKEITENPAESEDVTTQKIIQELEHETSTVSKTDIIVEQENNQKVLSESGDHKDDKVVITDSPMLIIDDNLVSTTPKITGLADNRTEPNPELDVEQKVESTTVQEPSPDVKISFEEGSSTTTIKPFDESFSVKEMPEMYLPSVIPGEGDCLVGQKTYENNSTVPASDECELVCKCVSSIVVCERVKCDVPENIENCILDEISSNKCCPAYICASKTLPSTSEDSVGSIEGNKDEDVKHKVSMQETAGEAHTEKSKLNTSKPISDAFGPSVSIPEIEMPVAITEEPMSHVKSEDEFEQQTTKYPVKIAEDKEDIFIEDHSSTTPSAVMKDIVAPQSITPDKISEHKIVNGEVSEKPQKEATPTHPTDQEQVEKKIEEQMFTHGSAESTTSSAIHVPSDKKEESEVYTTTAVPIIDKYQTVKPIKKEEFVGEHKVFQSSMPDSTTVPIESSSKKDIIPNTQTDKKETEEMLHHNTPNESEDVKEPAQGSDAQTIRPVAIDKINTLNPTKDEIITETSTTPDKDIDFSTALTATEETIPSLEDHSTNMYDHTTTLAPIKDHVTEFGEEDAVRTTTRSAIEDLEGSSTIKQQSSDEIKDHNIVTEDLNEKLESTSTLASVTEKVYDGISHPSKMDYEEIVKPTKDELYEEEIELTTVVSETGDKVLDHTVSSIISHKNINASQAPITQSSTSKTPINDYSEQSQPEAQTHTATTDEYSTVHIPQENVEKDNQEEIQTTAVSVSDENVLVYTTPASADTVTDTEKYSSMDEVSTDVSSHNVTEDISTPASIETEKSDESQEIVESQTIHSNTENYKEQITENIMQLESEKTEITPIEIITEYTKEENIIPSVEHVKKEPQPSMDHTVGPIVEKEDTFTIATTSDEPEPQLLSDHSTTGPITSDEYASGVIDDKEDSIVSVPEPEKPNESITLAPVIEIESTHIPAKQPSLDLIEEASGESIESEEESSTQRLDESTSKSPTKAPGMEIDSTHIPAKQPSLHLIEEASGESIESEEESSTQRLEESTSKSPIKASIEEEKEASSEESEENYEMHSTTKKTNASTIEQHSEMSSTTEHVETSNKKDLLTTEKILEADMSSYVTKAPIAQNNQDPSVTSKDVFDQMTEKGIILSVTSYPSVEQNTEQITGQETKGAQPSGTESPITVEDIKYTTVPQTEVDKIIIDIDISTEKSTEEEEEILTGSDVSSEEPGNKNMAHITSVPTQQYESEYSTVSEALIPSEDVTDKTLEENNNLDATKAPSSTEDTGTDTALHSQEESGQDVIQPDEIGQVTKLPEEEEEDVETSTIKFSLVSDEIQHVTDKYPTSADDDSTTEKLSDEIESEEPKITSALLPSKETSENKTSHIPQGEVQHATEQQISSDVFEKDIDILSTTNVSNDGVDLATVKPSKESEETLEVTEKLETGASTTKLPDFGDDTVGIAITEVNKNEEEINQHSISEHVTELLSLENQSEEESHEYMTEMPGSDEVLSSTLTDIIEKSTELPTDSTDSKKDEYDQKAAEVSTENLSEEVTVLPEEESFEEATKLSNVTQSLTNRFPELPKDISYLPPKDVESIEKIAHELPAVHTESSKELDKGTTDLPFTTEVSIVKLSEQDTEQQTKDTHIEDEKSIEQTTELTSDDHVSKDNLPEHITKQPTKDLESEEESHQESDELIPDAESATKKLLENVTELPIQSHKTDAEILTIKEEMEAEDQVTQLPMDVVEPSEKIPEHITDVPSKEKESEIAHESADKLLKPIDDSPPKDIKIQENSSKEPTDKLSELPAEHVAPVKEINKIATESPNLVHEISNSGQAIEHTTESAFKTEEPSKASSTQATEDTSAVNLLPDTTAHPLFPHYTTLLSEHFDSQTEKDSSYSESVTAKDDKTFATYTTTTVSTTTSEPATTSAPHYQPPIYGQPPQYGPTQYEDEYTDEDEGEVFGPGTCRYGGKLYVSAQQIPRDDPCDFCFCFRSDIICLQQSCPPPISGCHEEPISGFCCPRYECPVSMATVLNITTSTTTTSTTLPPHFLHHSYGNNAKRNGCFINGRSYRVGEKIESTSGPCINCTCGGDGKMKCDPQACVPEPTMQQVMAVVAAGRKR